MITQSQPLIGGLLSANPWIWVAAFFTLTIYSFLYKDNVIYKIAENIFIGVAAGYLLVIQYFNIIVPDLIDPLIKSHKFSLLIPLVLMTFMLLRISSKLAWLSRIPISFVVGVGAGLAIPNTIKAMVLEQVRGTLQVSFSGGAIPVIGSIILVVGTIITLVYFFFSTSHEGTMGYVARVGTWIIMIGFGASFGYTVMARISLLIGRVLFLMRDWLMVIG